MRVMICYATQHLQYLPYGETFVDQHGAFDSRYTFSAKEKDDELQSIREYRLLIKQEDEQTQYSYFGARYYDSDLSVWLSVDPMSDSRSRISPYNYCQWNPVGRVDPTGALDGLNDDGYTVDLQGNIEWVDYTGGDNYDVIFNKADYEAGKREYDETGTKNGIKIFRKEVVDFKVGVIPIYEYQNEVPTDETTSYKLVLNNPETAEKVFSFFSRNAGVEYSNEYYSKGDETLNIIFTANMPGTVPGNYVRAQKYKKAGWTLRRFDHSHPNNDPNPSDYGWESGDLPNKDSIMSLFPGIEILFNVYTPGNNKYNPY